MTKVRRVFSSLIVVVTATLGLAMSATPAAADGTYTGSVGGGSYRVSVTSYPDRVFVWLEISDTSCDAQQAGVEVQFKISGGTVVHGRNEWNGYGCGTTRSMGFHVYPSDLNGYHSGYVTFRALIGNPCYFCHYTRHGVFASTPYGIG